MRLQMQHVSCGCGWKGVRQADQRRYRVDKGCPNCTMPVRRCELVQHIPPELSKRARRYLVKLLDDNVHGQPSPEMTKELKSFGIFLQTEGTRFGKVWNYWTEFLNPQDRTVAKELIG